MISTCERGRHGGAAPTGILYQAMSAIGKVLLGLGAVLVVVGLMLIGLERLGVRGWRLPGDIVIQRDGFSFYFPLGTSILISIVLTLLLTFWAWLSARGR
jgi:hypothetical protein